MALQEQTKYTRDTRSNILDSSPSAPGEIAFATDSESLLISVDQTRWQEIQSDATIDKEYTLPNYSGTKISQTPLLHYDAANRMSFKNTRGEAPEPGDLITRWEQTTNNKQHIRPFTQKDGEHHPTYVVDSGNGKPGLRCMDQGMYHDDRFTPHMSTPYTLIMVYTPIKDVVTERAWRWGEGPATFQGIVSGDFGGGLERKDITIINNVREKAAGETRTWHVAADNTAPLSQGFPNHTIVATGTSAPSLSSAVLSGQSAQTIATHQGNLPGAVANSPSYGSKKATVDYTILGNSGGDEYDYDGITIIWGSTNSHHEYINRSYPLGSISDSNTSWPRSPQTQNTYRYMTTNSPLNTTQHFNNNYLGKPQIMVSRVERDEFSDDQTTEYLHGCGTYMHETTGSGKWFKNYVGTQQGIRAEGFQLGISGRVEQGSYKSHHDYNEIIYFPTLLSNSEINAIGEWLADKWDCEFWDGV